MSRSLRHAGLNAHAPSRDQFIIAGGGAVGQCIARWCARTTDVLVVDPSTRAIRAAATFGIPTAFELPDRKEAHDDAILVIATTRDAAPEVLAQWPDPRRAICIANGFASECADAAAAGVVEFSATVAPDGAAARCFPGALVLPLDSHADTTRRLARAICQGGGRARLVSDIAPIRNAKMVLNAAFEPLTALTGWTYGAVMRHASSRRIAAALLAEAIAVLDANRERIGRVQRTSPRILQAALSAPVMNLAAGAVAGRLARHVVSVSSRAVAEGRETEIKHLNGYLVQQAEIRGVTAPTHRAVLETFELLRARPWRPDPQLLSLLNPSSPTDTAAVALRPLA